MKLRQLVTINIKGNWHRYHAYFLSNVFAVMIFFMYAVLIYHPDIVNVNKVEPIIGSSIIICEYLIIIFTFFFTLYSSRSFLNSRQKEFGLLTLFGMNKMQVRRLIFYENMTISILSITVGIVIATFMTKLFLLALSHMLRVEAPFRFHIESKAIVLTVGSYIVLFICTTVFSLRSVQRTQIIELIRGDKKTKTVPTCSWIFIVICFISLALGYRLAYITDEHLFIKTALPTIGLTVIGTYFLFTQGSIAIIRLLQKNKRIYYRKTNFLYLPQIIFKLKENARVSCMISILCTVILTATATVYAIVKMTEQQMLDNTPQVYSIIWNKNKRSPLSVELVSQWGKQLHHPVTNFANFRIIQVKYKQLSSYEHEVYVMGITEFQRLTSMEQTLPVKYKEQDVVFFTHTYLGNVSSRSNVMVPKQGAITFTTNQKDIIWKGNVSRIETKTILNTNLGLSPVAVVNDKVFATLFTQVPSKQIWHGQGYNWYNWEYSYKMDQKINTYLSLSGEDYHISSRIQEWHPIMRIVSFGLFIGIFVSCLFFMMSSSIIYFKLFMDLQEARIYFRGLIRMGVSNKEIFRIITYQVGLLFFAPCAVGSVHTLFAMKTLSNLLNMSMLGNTVTIIGLFFFIQTVFFFFARNIYTKQIVKCNVDSI